VLGLVVLDETVVGLALPSMRSELPMSLVATHWVVNAYLLTFTCFVAVGGRQGGMLGQRAIFPVGAGLFLLGSLAAGAVPSGAWLIAARGLEGIGAAITFPASFAILTNAFPPEKRSAAFAMQTVIAAMFM
jgi:MFS family permease